MDHRSASSPPEGSDSLEAQAHRASLVRRIADYPPWPASTVWDPRVLRAIGAVPRHLFLPGVPLSEAYRDEPYPIGREQTISQPTVVAIMTQALELTGAERVLEIGTGCGYQAAVLARLASAVFSVERIAALGEAARARLASMGLSNIDVRIGDGFAGWPDQAPFDRVVVTAAPEGVPQALLDQLADGGLVVAPIGASFDQMLVRLRKKGDRVDVEELGPVRFVPMLPGVT
jgi:protein-L-isoaspartate(D-aspartate) O-methyltransferase